jgi:hypothetical protein
MQNYASSSSAVDPGFVLAPPTCPTCNLGMRFMHATPIPFTPGLVSVSYVCNDCGRGTQRTLKGN